MNKKISSVLMSVGVVFVCSLLLFTSIDNKIADLFQRAMKPLAENSKVVMINIDDTAIDNIGTFPLNRDVYGKSLVVLKDLGASHVLFDINFFDKGLAKIDEKYVSQDLSNYIHNSFSQLKSGAFSVDRVENEVLVSVNNILKNADQELSNGLKFFDNSYLNYAFGFGNDGNNEEIRQWLSTVSAIKNIKTDSDKKTPVQKSVTTCLMNFLNDSKNAGSVNGEPDLDGTLRRVHLIHKFNDEYYGQLAFVPLLNYLGNPEVSVSDSKIILSNARIDENTVKTIVIPRAEDGSMLLKFPPKKYDDYNAISLWNIYRLYLLEQQLASYVQDMDSWGVFTLFEADSPKDLLDAFIYLREELYNGENIENEITYENYKTYRDSFYETINTVFSDENVDFILEKFASAIEDMQTLALVGDTIREAQELYAEYVSSFKAVQSQLEGAFVTVGVVATGTTDIGINQYEERYPNTGAHYTILNQILSEDFVDDSNPAFGILFALILCLVYQASSRKISGTGRQIFFGVSMIVIPTLLLFAFFLITKTYLSTAIPVISITLLFIIMTAHGFLTESKDRKFITNAFSQCLSKEVVKEIVANPSSFKLGGQKLEMTAIFTDIQKFSSFSELLTASQLVALLNYYLTKMSDIIMEERGTVDKYEGDAIIALVGAPVKMQDHAIRAVRAALNMKTEEEIMNQQIIQIASQPKPEGMDDDLYDAFTIMVKNGKKIFTRIGLNSGEMIAGYMGSENKKNYTMMGNNVNLASRLEGVNKQYSTGGILMSQATKELLENEVLVRRLDRVRVVNVNTPLRLYEPMGITSNIDKKTVEYVKSWEEAMDAFENENFETAFGMFESLHEQNPNDGVASYYIRLISEFFLKGKYPKESDNFGVEYMPEDKVFKLLQK